MATGEDDVAELVAVFAHARHDGTGTVGDSGRRCPVGMAEGGLGVGEGQAGDDTAQRGVGVGRTVTDEVGQDMGCRRRIAT